MDKTQHSCAGSSSLALTWQAGATAGPTSRSTLQASTCPTPRAYMRGVYPPWLVSFGSAPGLPRR